MLELLLTPAFLDLGDVPVGTEVETHFTLTSEGGRVAVEDIQVSNRLGEEAFAYEGTVDGLTVTATGVDIPIVYRPGAAGGHRAEIAIASDAACGELLLLEVRARAVAPCLVVVPPFLDFGAVLAPGTGFERLEVTSCDQNGVVLDEVLIDDPAWSLAVTLPVEIGPGKTASIGVLYQPFDNEPARGTLTLQTSGAAVGEVTLAGNDCEFGDPRAYDTNGNGVSDCGVQINAVPEATDDDGDGFADYDGDCQDTDAAVFPGASERDNGLDDDCDGIVDEGFRDLDGDGIAVADGDCDDTAFWVNPDVGEFCGDRVDNDCDGKVDEDCAQEPCADDRGCRCGEGKALFWVPFLPLVGWASRRRRRLG